MVSLWCYYCAKILKKTDACKAKIAASEDFALAETFFALAESCPVRQIHPFPHFQPQFTHFQHKSNNTPAIPVIDEERPAPLLPSIPELTDKENGSQR